MDSRTASQSQPPSSAELLRRLTALERLLDVTRKLAVDIDTIKVLETITGEACKALDCDRASLYQYDPQQEELYTRVVTELEIAEVRHRLDRGITGYVARHRVVENIPEPAQDPRWDSSVDRATGYRTRSILAAPLTSPHDGCLLGVLQLLNKRGGPFGKFDEELLEAFSQHAAVALDRARLVDELRRRNAVEASLAVARDIQRSFMPRELPAFTGYELATWWYPNEAVGGDYCDVVRLRDGRIGLVVADVSGHGLGPSLIMASARASLRALIIDHAAPDVILELLGRSLAADLQDGWFITMALAVIDPASHRVTYANAGHGPAMHYVWAERCFWSLEATGVPLGVLDEPNYSQGAPVEMAVGDLLLLCTDGIVEAMNANEERFGQRRLEEVVVAHADWPVADLVRRIGSEVEGYYVGENPPDDLTILAARRTA